jgi:PAS domain S-box-containing protein
MAIESNGAPLPGDARQRYEQLVASIDGIVWEADARTFQFLFVSPQAEQLLGYPLKQWLVPGFWVKHLHPDDRTWAPEFCRQATRDKRKHDFEYRLLAADGRVVWLRDIVSVVMERGEAVRLRGIMVDVTDKRHAEEALRESESLYRLLADNSNDLIYLVDVDGNIVYASPSVGRLLGRVPRSKFEVVHPDDVAAGQSYWERILKGEKELLSIRVAAADGTWHWLEAWSSLLPYQGKPHVLSVCRDVTERKLAEVALRERDRQLRTLVENFPDFIARFDRDCRRLYVNPSVTRAFGLPLEHFVGKSLKDLAMPGPPGQNEALQAHIRQAAEEGVPNVGEAHWRTTRGERIFEIRHIPERDERGNVVSVLAISRDVTDARLAEEALRRSEREARNRLAEIEQIYRYAPIGLCSIDREYRFTRINESLAEINGLPVEEHIGKTLWDVVPKLADDLVEFYRPVFERGEPVLGQEVHGQTPKSPGVERDWLASYFPLKSETGEVIGLIGAVLEVTKRKRAEDELRASEARFRVFVDHATDAFFLHDADGTVLDVNRQACVSLGYTREELLGIHPSEFDTDFDAPKMAQIGARLEAGEVFTFDTHHRRKDGTVFPVEVRVRSFWEGGRRFGVSLARDITERKHAEEVLRRSEAYLAEAQRLSRTGSWAWDVSTRQFVHWSHEHYRLHGLDPQRGIPSWEEARQLIHPEDRARCLEGIERAIRERTYCDLEYRALLPDGTIKYVHSVAHPVFNASGELVEFVGTEMDVTERKRAEEAVRKSEERLRQAVRVSNLGIFDHDHLTETYYWSPEERAIHGWESATPPKLSEFLGLLHPEDRERITAAVRRAHDPAGDGCFDTEKRVVRPDGEVRWLVTRSQTFFEGEGAARHPVRTVGAVLDVTERKRAEESLRASLREKEVLLKEVHHRVKNNLQLISSLLALQAGQLKDGAAAEAFAECQNRVRAMALVHEDLYRSEDLASVRLAGHLESLCAHLLRSYNVDPDRIVLDLRVADVTLDLDRSMRVGLLVNELVSNVLKHAFPAGRGGRVLVQLDTPCAGCYSLVVSDNGVGLPPYLAPGHSDSLGLQLIADLTEQLGGSLALDREGGTTFIIRFPASCQEDCGS